MFEFQFSSKKILLSRTLTLWQLSLNEILLKPWNSIFRKIQAHCTIQLHYGIEDTLREEIFWVAHFYFVFQTLLYEFYEVLK